MVMVALGDVGRPPARVDRVIPCVKRPLTAGTPKRWRRRERRHGDPARGQQTLAFASTGPRQAPVRGRHLGAALASINEVDQRAPRRRYDLMVPPGVVVVSGLPASGKSTLARTLAKELGLVHIWKDDMRKALWPVLSVLPSRALTTVPRAMSDLVCTVLTSVLDAGHGGVVDANFNIPEQAEPIRALLDESGVPCFEVCLWADPVVLRKRFIERADPPLDT